MRFRRRFATGGRLSALLQSLQGRWQAFRSRHRDVGAAGDAPRETADVTGHAGSTRSPDWAASTADGAPPQQRQTVTIGPWTVRWPGNPRRLLIVAGLFMGTFVVGYGFAATILFPAPMFAARHSVPRVIGATEEAARETLRSAGFGVGAVDRAPHATVPQGAVFWQDPPPDVVALEATDVALTVSTGPQRVPVPDVAGYDAEDARRLIEGAGLRVGSTESTQAPTPRNVAVNTRPPAGATLPPGTDIVLVVSVGAATIRVPTLLGLTLDEARLALETAGLALGTSFAQTTDAAAPGEIFYQEPSAGTLSAPGTVVNVRMARSR
ncbi:MAG: PASTA domain-containing protein [Gemmatimonadota bacterium]|nr:PASTA domain-containing protein [Gemmatimonadota bacterium]MDH4349710.1 PASTA domain-containing protein [Gemmatimonadota bacterium]MDH5197080.1 PASTA domain-containing protein [Gemmatimonadota bacterium]